MSPCDTPPFPYEPGEFKDVDLDGVNKKLENITPPQTPNNSSVPTPEIKPSTRDLTSIFARSTLALVIPTIIVSAPGSTYPTFSPQELLSKGLVASDSLSENAMAMDAASTEKEKRENGNVEEEEKTMEDKTPAETSRSHTHSGARQYNAGRFSKRRRPRAHSGSNGLRKRSPLGLRKAKDRISARSAAPHRRRPGYSFVGVV